MVPRPRIELGTRRFSVFQQGLTLEILQHLVSIGQAAEQLSRSIQLDNSIASETLSKTGDVMADFELIFKEGDPTE